MLQSILSNVAIILLSHLVMSTLMVHRTRFPNYVISTSIVLIFSAAVISLFYLPIEYDGYFLDLRMVPLIILAVIRGKIVIFVLLLASFWRFFMGGEGAIPGILFGMIGPTLLALAFYKKNQFHKHYVGKIIMVTGCWLISDVPILFIIPNGMELFNHIFVYRYGSILGSSIILYLFIKLEYKRHDLKEKLRFLATHDSLTELRNKNSFFEQITSKIMSEGSNHHYVTMIDIDYFKKINDQYGHVVGDQVLVQLAAILKRYESDHIVVSRYGGEEFIIYHGHTRLKHAILTLEQIQRDIRAMRVNATDDEIISISVSMGIAEVKEINQLEDAAKCADEKLYLAKENGRDQLVS